MLKREIGLSWLQPMYALLVTGKHIQGTSNGDHIGTVIKQHIAITLFY